METILLGCLEYTERHTSENLCELLNSLLDAWKLRHKLTAIASDNAANIVAAIRAGNWRHIPCFAHSINGAVQASLVHINTTINKINQ